MSETTIVETNTVGITESAKKLLSNGDCCYCAGRLKVHPKLINGEYLAWCQSCDLVFTGEGVLLEKSKTSNTRSSGDAPTIY